MKDFTLSGNIVDLLSENIFKGKITVRDGKIARIEKDDTVAQSHYILPGLIDAHIHIESSMLVPSEFARLAVVHGTVATVSDPHEIANVLGVEGIDYMIRNGKKVPFRFYFGASSCVPATPFETAGNKIGLEELNELLARDDIRYLSEMMNFPGVINGDDFEMGKLKLAQKYGKPVDGHAPGLKGAQARKYIESGISTDHECFTMAEALEKISYGMKIQIREGSAAKNFDALIGLMDEHADKVLFCSDDKHPDDLVEGHINQMVKRAVHKGYSPMEVLKSAILNPVRHYGLDVGLLQTGDSAEMILVDNLHDFNILSTYVGGKLVAENGRTLIPSVSVSKPNIFHAMPVKTEHISVKARNGKMKVIAALDGELITRTEYTVPKLVDGFVVSDTSGDVLKMVVLNRYKKAAPAVAFVRNFGFRSGAIASSVAHDSHNVVAVGVEDEQIAEAINLVVENRGGVALVDGEKREVLPLPVAGLMSAEDGYKVARSYQLLDETAHQMGSQLKSPFMTLSFMSLLVIPQLKLSDRGLFDGNTFTFTGLFEETVI